MIRYERKLSEMIEDYVDMRLEGPSEENCIGSLNEFQEIQDAYHERLESLKWEIDEFVARIVNMYLYDPRWDKMK